MRSLTGDTSDALFLTLTGLVHMTRMLLNKLNFEYVLLGKFQSDLIEGAYGGFRQGSGGNYHISYEQIISSLALQRLKLFDKLDMEYSNEHDRDDCCTRELDDKEIGLLDVTPSLTDIDEGEKSTLYYICGYIAMKQGIGLDAPEVDTPVSEFTNNVSRGKLKHPSEDLFDLSLRLLCTRRRLIFKHVQTEKLKLFVVFMKPTYHFLKVQTNTMSFNVSQTVFLKDMQIMKRRK